MGSAFPDFKNDSFAGLIGVSQTDVTPPPGIYIRNWGAGNQGASTGIHMPLMLTCLSFQSETREKPLILIAGDFGVWVNAGDGKKIRDAILKALSLSPADCMFNLSHTHAGPILSGDESDKPGGQYINAYLQKLEECAVRSVKECLNSAVPAVLTWNYGKCSLATNRDLRDIENNRYVVGFNQYEKADDTLLVGRITNEQNLVLGTIVNYACHPTTLAWDNHLVSPDFIGSMREIVEANTSAPCLFLQGASGELAPAEQYSGAISIAEKNGRVLGYSVLSALEDMLPPKTKLSLVEIVESGAPLAIWKRTPYIPSGELKSEMIDISYRLKALPSLEKIERDIGESKDPVTRERLRRQRNIRIYLGDGETIRMQVWIWKMGSAFLVGQPNEAYSEFQKELRRYLSPGAVAVMNLVNGSAGYLPPRKLYEDNIYQVWQSPFCAGSLEMLIQETKKALDNLSAA